MTWSDQTTPLVDLKDAIADGRLAGLKGMGAKSVEQVAQGIRFAEQSAGRTPLGLACMALVRKA